MQESMCSSVFLYQCIEPFAFLKIAWGITVAPLASPKSVTDVAYLLIA